MTINTGHPWLPARGGGSCLGFQELAAHETQLCMGGATPGHAQGSTVAKWSGFVPVGEGQQEENQNQDETRSLLIRFV